MNYFDEPRLDAYGTSTGDIENDYHALCLSLTYLYDLEEVELYEV